MMKNKACTIGIDGRPLIGDLTGIGIYTLYLTRALATLHKGNIVVYTPGFINPAYFQTYSNIKVRVLPCKKRIFWPLWGQLQLAYAAMKDKVNIFWSPRHHLPLLLPKHIKTLVSIHDLNWKICPESMPKNRYWLEKLLMRPSLRKASHILSVSQTTKSDLSKYFHLNSNIISIVYSARIFKSSSATVTNDLVSHYSRQQTYILALGTIEPRKNYERLLQAYSKLSTDLKESCHLLIVGGQGWGNVHLETLINNLNLQAYVKWLGYCSDEEVETLLQHCFGLVQPSIYEGFGLPVLEAMSLGKPILTSNISATAEIAEEAAVLVDPFSITDIKMGLEKLLTDKENNQRLSQAGLRRAQDFSWEKSAEKMQKIIHSLQ